MTGFKNYAACLSQDALLLLLSFDAHHELLMPHEALKAFVSHSDVNNAIQECRRENLIRKEARPFRLTRLGIRVVKNLNKTYALEFIKNEEGKPQPLLSLIR